MTLPSYFSPSGLACVIHTDSTMSGLIKDSHSLAPSAHLLARLLCLSEFVFQSHTQEELFYSCSCCHSSPSTPFSTKNKLKKCVRKYCRCTITETFRSEKEGAYNAKQIQIRCLHSMQHWSQNSCASAFPAPGIAKENILAVKPVGNSSGLRRCIAVFFLPCSSLMRALQWCFFKIVYLLLYYLLALILWEEFFFQI